MTGVRAPIYQPDPEGAAAAPAALRSALVEAIARRRRRLRYRVAIAGGVCVAAAAVLGGGVLFTGGPERVLAIDNGSEWVRVRILDGDAGAAEMTRELQDAGIDGEVQQVPAVPPLVGHWMGMGVPRTPERNPAITTVEPGVGGIAVGIDQNAFVLRRDYVSDFFPGKRLIFYVGREPDAGETPLDAPPQSGDVTVLRLGDLQNFNRPRIAKFAQRKGIQGVAKMSKWEILEALRHSR
jgi:hypothetical protein